MIVEKCELEEINLSDYVFKTNIFILFDLFKRNEIKKNCLFFINDKIIGFTKNINDKFEVDIIFHSDQKVNLIKTFQEILGIDDLKENEYLWLKEKTFNDTLMIMSDEVVGGENLEVVFINDDVLT